MRIVTAALAVRPLRQGSDLRGAIAALPLLVKRHGFIIIISDFLATGWEQELVLTRSRHECLAVRISDPVDAHFPGAGLIPVEDPETRKRVNALAHRGAFHDLWAQWYSEHASSWEAICQRSGVATLELSTAEDAAIALPRFFASYHKRVTR
jgi:uncharacterized protein (DUF58 family)